jgi:hypothetical protein
MLQLPGVGHNLVVEMEGEKGEAENCECPEENPGTLDARSV